MEKSRFTPILRFIVKMHIRMLYFFTEHTIPYALLGLIITYGIYAQSYSIIRLLCLSFTLYCGITSISIYIICKDTTYYRLLIRLVGIEFIKKYLGEESE